MKKILALMGAVLLLSVSARAVEVSAPSALLMEKRRYCTLCQNEHEKLEPASVTKVMTLLLTFEALEAGRVRLDDAVPVSEHAYHMAAADLAGAG